MIKAEWQYIKQHKLQLIVLLIIVMIPSIYAVTFLKSMWDPYGQTNKLAVAVVNHDQPVALNGKNLTLGKNLVSNLEASTALDFKAVSANKAEAGLKDGQYYAIYTIPKHFSKNATTVFTKHPKQLQLQVEQSTGHNLFAGKITATAANSVQAKVNGQLNTAYTKTLVAGLNKLAKGMTAAETGATKLTQGSTQLTTGIGQFNAGLTNLVNGQQSLETSTSKLAAGTEQYVAGVNTAASSSTTLTSGLTKIQSGSDALAAGAAKLSAGIDTFKNNSATLAEKSQAFNQSLSAFAKQVNQSEQAGTNNLAQLATLIQATQTAINQMQSAASQTSTATSENVAKAAAGLNLTPSQTKVLTDAVTNTYTASNTRQQAALAPLLTKLQSALESLQTATSRQDQTANTVSSALSQLTNGSSQLAQGNARLSSTAETQLAPGAVSLATGSATLNSGINRLDAGAKKLDAGLETLSASGQTLISGNQQLSAGAQKLLTGGQKLSTADNQLTEGVATISKGNQQLSTRLANGTKQLPKLHFTSATAHMITSPTKVTDHDRDSVPNNGTAMMPYMAGVALYVSGMVLNMLLDTVTPRRKPKRVVDWWASKAVMIDGTAIAAATVELLTLIGIAGLRPTNIFATWITLSLANLAMTNMITWLNLSIGRLGSLVAMILLTFQLGSAGGTYPIELSNAFFEAIHPFLPMSYVVDGLRHTVMMNSWPTTDLLILAGFFVGFSALNFLNYVRRSLRTNALEFDSLNDTDES